MATDPTSALFALALRDRKPDPRRPLMIGAGAALARATGIAAARWTAIEPWRPAFEALCEAGFDPVPILASDAAPFDLALVRLGRQRARNLAQIADAILHTAADGLVVVAGENAIGAGAYARPLGRPQSLSKHHCRAFRFRAADGPHRGELEAWSAALQLQPQGDDGHLSAPGIFAWDRVDAGSQLLARSLPPDLAGNVADLGAGWGYLAREVIARCPAVTSVDLFEADWHALAAARANLAMPRPGVAIGFHWHDITRALPGGAFDAIVTNPPFHAGLRAEPAIGVSVIRSAARALRPQGSLWLVANRHLPYEATLSELFARVAKRAEAEGYKVIEAGAKRR